MPSVAKGYDGVEISGTKRKGKGELSSVDISFSANGGFVLRQYYRQKESRGNGSVGWIEPETLTFESKAALMAHLTRCLPGK